jgi:hypothetical protein
MEPVRIDLVYDKGCWAILFCIAGTGEHGVGIGKKVYLVEELGEGTVALLRALKQVIDPLNLFNPGKASVCVLEQQIH